MYSMFGKANRRSAYYSCSTPRYAVWLILVLDVGSYCRTLGLGSDRIGDYNFVLM
jgi:hypothetical protein